MNKLLAITMMVVLTLVAFAAPFKLLSPIMDFSIATHRDTPRFDKRRARILRSLLET